MADVFKTCYISCACNRTPCCVDWGYNGLVCFGASHAVAICDVEHSATIISTLVGHSKRVNAVRWIRSEDGAHETEFVSSSLDKSAILWRKSEDSEFRAVCKLEGHNGSVTAVDALYLDRTGATNSRLLIVTASADSTLKIWGRHSRQDECTCSQTISLGNGLVISLSVTLLPHSSAPLIACGQDNSKICLYTEQQGQFAVVHHLSGHEQWIRDLSFTVDDNKNVLLASCGQDCYIRLWRISLLNELAKSDDVVEEEAALKLRDVTFSVSSNNDDQVKYTITLESVLHGHENWVSSVRWQPAVFNEGKRSQPLSLLSSSMDKTVIVWQPNCESGIWMEKVRVGEVGGSNLGFYGSMFSADGESILAHGYQGAFHMWRHNELTGSWLSTVTCGGHFGPVNDLVWGINAEFLLTVSSDQTTRLHALWSSADRESRKVWHEIARPQIHGYDIQCIDLIDRFTFASGADEKVIRIFTAPRNYVENFKSLCQADVEVALKKMEGVAIAEGASVPALGLSNKAVYASCETQAQKNTQKSDDQYAESYFSPQQLLEPPSEENLLQNTLWPEMQKLYGHGNEVYAIACCSDGTLLASACKATKSDQAAVFIWDTSTWRPMCRLESHALTVTQLSFSHSGQFLLSVSRDRTWTIFQRRQQSDPEETPIFRRVAFADKKTAVHSRIIWACAWSHDDKFFVTVSRDKKAVIWNSNNCDTAESCLAGWRALSVPLELNESVTAVDFAPVTVDLNRHLLAFGVEGGSIHLVTWTSSLPQSKTSWHLVCVLDQSMAHHLTVKRLRFCGQTIGEETLKLASCAEDNTVKIFDVYLSSIRNRDVISS